MKTYIRPIEELALLLYHDLRKNGWNDKYMNGIFDTLELFLTHQEKFEIIKIMKAQHNSEL